jgi:hypothetical protein
MLFSQTLEDRQISFFRSMLAHLLAGKEAYTAIVDPVIADARALVRHEKDYFTIDRDSYHVIVRLAQGDSEFLRELDADHMNRADYEQIDKLLSGQRDLAFA